MPSHVPSGARRPEKDRRAAPGTAPALSRLKGALGRPIGLERRDGGLHVVLVDRRRRPSHPLADLCAELSARVLDHQDSTGTPAMNELVGVHDALERRGWDGVAPLTATTLKRALLQAELLTAQDTTPTLSAMVDKLRLLHAAAEARDDRLSRRTIAINETTDISESTHEEFEAVTRVWAESTTAPAPALNPNPDADPAR